MSDKSDDKSAAERQERERAAHTPQGDHTPRQEEQHARERQQQRADTKAAPAAAADQPDPNKPPVDPDADAAARAAASIGAQIILDYNEDGSIGARGGAGGSVEENTLARDAHLVAIGLDPVAPSGPPPTPEQLKAKQEQAEKPAPAFLSPAGSGKATRTSSLAAGISGDNVPPSAP